MDNSHIISEIKELSFKVGLSFSESPIKKNIKQYKITWKIITCTELLFRQFSGSQHWLVILTVPSFLPAST